MRFVVDALQLETVALEGLAIGWRPREDPLWAARWLFSTGCDTHNFALVVSLVKTPLVVGSICVTRSHFSHCFTISLVLRLVSLVKSAIWPLVTDIVLQLVLQLTSYHTCESSLLLVSVV